MKAEFNINCPLSLDEANEIKKCLRNMILNCIAVLTSTL